MGVTGMFNTPFSLFHVRSLSGMYLVDFQKQKILLKLVDRRILCICRMKLWYVA